MSSPSSPSTTEEGRDKKKFTSFVPGRVCMLGEHSDWAGGHRSEEHPHVHHGVCLAYCTDVGIDLEAEVVSPKEQKKKKQNDDDDDDMPHSPTGIVLQYSFLKKKQKLDASSQEQHEEEELVERRVPFSLEALEAHATAGDFFSHVCGTAAEMLHRFGDSLIKGVKRHHDDDEEEAKNNSSENEEGKPASTLLKVNCVSMTLPMKKGLSSSAAIGVGLARLFGSIAGVSPGEEEERRAHEMDVAYRGELRTGSQCGRLDQVCAHGPGAFVRMKFDGQHNLPVCEPVRVSSPFYFVVCDLNAQKDTRVILRDLNSAFPVPKDEVDHAVHDALGPENHRLIAAAEEALMGGDPIALGAVFNAAQKVFDEKIAPKCKAELSAPRLHAVLDDEGVRRASCGGKGVGSQGDGSAQFVCKDAAQQEELCRVLLAIGCTPMKFTLTPSS